jgi:hypothetical protein
MRLRWGALIGLFFSIAFNCPGQAQDCPDRYQYDARGRCAPVGTTSSRAPDNADDLAKLTNAIKNSKKLKLDREVFNYFDLSIEGICGKDGFEQISNTFLARAANYFLLRERRAVALTVTISEVGKNTKETEFEIPILVAKPGDAGAKPVVNCGRSLRSNYHRETKIGLKFNFYASKERFEVPSAVTGFTKFLTAIFSLSSKPLTGSIAGAAATKLFLGDIDKIVAATNEFLQDFEMKTDGAVMLDILEGEGGVSIASGGRSSIRITKQPRDTILFSGLPFKGGFPGAAFKNVTGKEFQEVMSAMVPDATKLGSGGTNDSRRAECSRVSGRFGDFVMGLDRLLLMHNFIQNRAALFTGHNGYNCLEPSDAVDMRDKLKLPPPYQGAYEQAITQAPPRVAEDRKTFDKLLVELEGLATLLRNTSLIRRANETQPDSAQAKALKKEALEQINETFSNQVDLDGSARAPLFPSGSLATAEEIADTLYAAPVVSRMGCFMPVVDEVGKEHGYEAQFVLKVETTPPAILHVQVKSVPSGEGVTISKIWVGKLGRAKAAFALKFAGGCGSKAPFWLPWKEIDDAVAFQPSYSIPYRLAENMSR